VETGNHTALRAQSIVSCFFPFWLDGEPGATASFALTPGDGIDGYAREVVVTPATHFTRAPTGYSHREAATLTTAGLTAWRALVVNGGLKPGDTVLALGTGGVSIFALQIAKAMGRAWSSPHRGSSSGRGRSTRDQLPATENWGSAVLDWTDGRGVDHVVEVGGPGTLPQSIEACRVGGHISLIGVLTGIGGEVPTATLMRRQQRLQGLIVGSRKHQQDFVRALDVLPIRPVIDRTYPLAETAEAFRYEMSGGHFGKICLDV
jgi:NADPH:quinone reductase-like Zn-dependent oxidoreductase